MAKRGRPKPELILIAQECEQLGRYARRGKTSQRLALRARIVLDCAKGLDNKAVTKALRGNQVTVGKWRAHFVENRMGGLPDAPRPGAPRQVGDDKVEAIIVDTLESMPKGASRWSTRAMAKKAGIGASSVSRVWRAFGLKPHRTQSFLST